MPTHLTTFSTPPTLTTTAAAYSVTTATATACPTSPANATFTTSRATIATAGTPATTFSTTTAFTAFATTFATVPSESSSIAPMAAAVFPTWYATGQHLGPASDVARTVCFDRIARVSLCVDASRKGLATLWIAITQRHSADLAVWTVCCMPDSDWHLVLWVRRHVLRMLLL